MRFAIKWIIVILAVLLLVTALDITVAHAVTGGGWSVQKKFSNEYLATFNGHLMACRNGKVNIHKWGPTPIGDEFNYWMWNTACFRGPASNHRLWFSYYHWTVNAGVCNAICSLNGMSINVSHYGCWGGIWCQMVGVSDEGSISTNYDLLGIHNTFLPQIEFHWTIVPWAPGRGQIGVSTQTHCGGC